MARLLLILICASLAGCQTSRLVDLDGTSPALVVDLRYKTTSNITGKPLYSASAKAKAAPVLAEAFRNAEAILEKEGYGVTLYDAWRPLDVTRELWKQAIKQHVTAFYAPPYVGSNHNRGAAVDVGLHRLKEPSAVLPMPMPFDGIEPSLANRSSEAVKNERILRKAFEAAGFVRNSNECWHFDYPPAESCPLL